MSAEELPYTWEHIQRYFPKNEVAQMRKRLLEDRGTREYTDRQLMRRYRMSKQTFYDTVKRYSNANRDDDYLD